MALETDFIEALKAIATDPAARGLTDDAAVLGDLVLTHDMIVEGVHFLPDDSPQDVAWKLVAVNLSDLAAKGARPIGVLTGAGLTADADWNAQFVAGLGLALAHWAVPLLGGDTVAMPKGAPRALGLTALGRAAGPVPAWPWPLACCCRALAISWPKTAAAGLVLPLVPAAVAPAAVLAASMPPAGVSAVSMPSPRFIAMTFIGERERGGKKLPLALVWTGISNSRTSPVPPAGEAASAGVKRDGTLLA